jgi:hypothetical protein
MGLLPPERMQPAAGLGTRPIASDSVGWVCCTVLPRLPLARSSEDCFVCDVCDAGDDAFTSVFVGSAIGDENGDGELTSIR